MRVGDVMTVDVATVGADTTLAEAARTMRARRVSGLPVVEGETLVGIITEGDLMRLLQRIDVPAYVDVLGGLFAVPGPGHIERQLRQVTAYRVDQLMTRRVVTIGPDEDVSAAAQRMARSGVKRLPVLDEGSRLIGIVSRSDLLKALF